MWFRIYVASKIAMDVNMKAGPNPAEWFNISKVIPRFKATQDPGKISPPHSYEKYDYRKSHLQRAIQPCCDLFLKK